MLNRLCLQMLKKRQSLSAVNKTVSVWRHHILRRSWRTISRLSQQLLCGHSFQQASWWMKRQAGWWRGYFRQGLAMLPAPTTSQDVSLPLWEACRISHDRLRRSICGCRPLSSVSPSTKASTSRMQPSAMLSTRSTSPPKSLCPGVSITLIFTPL